VLISAWLAAAVMCAAASAASSADPSAAQARWPERLLVREGLTVAGQAVSTGFLYALISETHTPIRGPYRLERTNLHTGTMRKGPTFSLGYLAVAAGRLWLSGASGRQVRVLEVDPRSLTAVRSIVLPREAAGSTRVAVAAGPGRSVWVGSSRTLLRVDAATGAVLTRVIVPARLDVGDLAVDPSRRHVYVSTAHLVKGGIEAVLFEYDARSGRELARASTGLITYSVAGAELTAVPGGVWASFRTGMLGLTIHLRQRDLALVAPPGPGIAKTPATGIFHWPMSATTLYAGGALWLSNESGIVACLDPRTGKVRASERVSPSATLDLLAADAVSHRLYGLEGPGLVRLTPPRRCWS